MWMIGSYFITAGHWSGCYLCTQSLSLLNMKAIQSWSESTDLNATQLLPVHQWPKWDIQCTFKRECIDDLNCNKACSIRSEEGATVVMESASVWSSLHHLEQVSSIRVVTQRRAEEWLFHTAGSICNFVNVLRLQVVLSSLMHHSHFAWYNPFFCWVKIWL